VIESFPVDLAPSGAYRVSAYLMALSGQERAPGMCCFDRYDATLITLLSYFSITSYILASTEELHAKIDQLLERTRDLEVALEASNSLHSNQTHALLKKELLVEGSRLALERDHDEEEEVPVVALETLKSKHSLVIIASRSALL